MAVAPLSGGVASAEDESSGKWLQTFQPADLWSSTRANAISGAGHAIHYNYWSNNWGYAGSHGCLGMNYDDSLWFWNWATIGTPIVIHW